MNRIKNIFSVNSPIRRYTFFVGIIMIISIYTIVYISDSHFHDRYPVWAVFMVSTIFVIGFSNIVGLMILFTIILHYVGAAILHSMYDIETFPESHYEWYPSYVNLLEGTDGIIMPSIIIEWVMYLAARRCSDAGISKWRILMPLYNPIVLLFGRSKTGRKAWKK